VDCGFCRSFGAILLPPSSAKRKSYQTTMQETLFYPVTPLRSLNITQIRQTVWVRHTSKAKLAISEIGVWRNTAVPVSLPFTILSSSSSCNSYSQSLYKPWLDVKPWRVGNTLGISSCQVSVINLLGRRSPATGGSALQIDEQKTFTFRAQSRTKANIVTCMGVRVTKITGSRSDEWIYWHFDYKFS
jgi:hypothetical protein